MGKLFGTDGVRGIANKELTAELAYKIGKCGAYVLTQETKHRPKIIVGKDTRISGDMLENALVSGICAVGGDAVLLGVVPTPCVAYLVRHYKADAGVVISASHNPMEYNGIKFFNHLGQKLPDATEEHIEHLILEGNEEIKLPEGADIGQVFYRFDAIKEYEDFAMASIDCDLSGMKIAIDCANGASYRCAAEVLQGLGAKVSVCCNEPDGTNINDGCGSTHIENIARFVKAVGADVGLAFDGDADRVLAVDENGELVDGDVIMAICGNELKRQGRLKDNTIVATVMSNMGLFAMGDQNGIHIAKTKVGDRYVLEEMLKNGYVLGGEQSGHIIFLEQNTTGDGLITGLYLLSIMKKSEEKLSSLAKVMTVYPQVLRNAKIKNENKQAYLKDKQIMSEINRIENLFHGEGRVLIRPSGTEPLVRVMIEGKDFDLMKKEAEILSRLIEEKLG